MKIVILDGYVENPGDLSWGPLAALGELTVYDRTSLTDPAEAIGRIGDAEIAITNKTPLPAQVLDGCPNLKFIAVLATGYNVVDCTHAAKRGIPVSNVPAYGTQAVAQFAMALLLEICCQVALHNESVRVGDWGRSLDFCYWKAPVMELSGKTMGIIGFGRIGQAMGRMAKAMGMEVLATGSRPTAEGEAIARYVDLDTLLARSDVISLHCPLFPETKELINRHTIAKMKDGVILINSSRGGLLNEADVAQALNSGKLGALGADVVSTEPIREDNPLLGAKNAWLTPHIAWSSQDCRQRILDTTVGNVRAFLDGSPRNVVNKGSV